MWHRDNDLLRQGKQPATGSSSSGMTVDQLCRQYLNLAEKHKRSWKEDQRQINFDILPAWKNRIASEITYDDANKLITEVYETRNSPRSAEKLVALGRFIFNLATGNITKAKRKQWFTPSFNTRINPWFEIKKNPFADIELPEREENSCVLKGKDLKSYLRNLDTTTFSDDVCNVLKLQLWCNTRISEPAQMDWKEIDLEDGVWTIPKDRTKTKAELDVMLPSQAIELLLSLEPKDSGYVFAFNDIRRENIVTHIAEQIRNNRKHLGVPDNFSSHSLRHTGQTLLASMECPVEVRDRVSNHKPNKKTNMSAKYDSHEYDKPARTWLQTMADKLDELAIPNIVHIGDRDAN